MVAIWLKAHVPEVLLGRDGVIWHKLLLLSQAHISAFMIFFIHKKAHLVSTQGPLALIFHQSILSYEKCHEEQMLMVRMGVCYSKGHSTLSTKLFIPCNQIALNKSNTVCHIPIAYNSG